MGEIIIKGAIGNTQRQNRDNMRVLGKGGEQLHAEIPHPHRQTPCSKEIQKVGQVANHQWGIVYHYKGCSPTIQARDYKYPATVIKRWKNSQKAKP